MGINNDEMWNLKRNHPLHFFTSLDKLLQVLRQRRLCELGDKLEREILVMA